MVDRFITYNYCINTIIINFNKFTPLICVKMYFFLKKIKKSFGKTKYILIFVV